MSIRLSQSSARLLFFFGVSAVYAGLIVKWSGLNESPIWDEQNYWKASLFFSNHPLPTLQDLNNYGELNTPLPFIVFGAIERWFHLGIAAGRWLNVLLSLCIVSTIGWPRQAKKNNRQPTDKRAAHMLLCLAGLLLCPYFLFVSGRLYTDIMACFWVLVGYMGYIHKRHALSNLAFILAIASRQYMLAFPVAIATYELAIIGTKMKNAVIDCEQGDSLIAKLRQCFIDLDWKIAMAAVWPCLAATTSALSIIGWIYIFGGLTPSTAAVHSIQTDNPASWAVTQRTFWSVRPGVALNFLAYVGLYIVLPEWLLFQPAGRLRSLKQRWRSAISIAAVLLLLFLYFPPLVKNHGILARLIYDLPAGFVQLAPLYGLALLSCLRFSCFEPLTLMVVFNSSIVLKAHPWDKYVLPLVVTFWYAKSVGLTDKSSQFFPELFQR